MVPIGIWMSTGGAVAQRRLRSRAVGVRSLLHRAGAGRMGHRRQCGVEFSFPAAALAGSAGRGVGHRTGSVLVCAPASHDRRLQGPTSAPIAIVAAAVASGNALCVSFKLRSAHVRPMRLPDTALAKPAAHAADSRHRSSRSTLDCLLDQLPRPPDILKCDVEGAELRALEGARQTKFFEQARPAILCEVSAKNGLILTKLWRNHRYRLWDAERPLSLESEVKHAAWNTIGIPEEAVSRYFKKSAGPQSVVLSDVAGNQP